MVGVTYEEAFRAFHREIVRYCLSEFPNDCYCAEDLASECFMLLYRKWDTLQSHAPTTVRVWLFRTARNKVLDCKKKKRLQTVSLDDESGRARLEREAAHLLHHLDEREETERYRHYLTEIRNALTELEWRLFDLVVNQEQPFRQVSERLGTTEAAAKMRWHRLRAKLKDFLSGLFAQMGFLTDGHRKSPAEKRQTSSGHS
ncbi:MAG TPA: hypothetical protein DDW30_02560 [Clostridiales bacterium]|nr:hypothetical protein [Clostridiales bacterium]